MNFSTCLHLYLSSSLILGAAAFFANPWRSASSILPSAAHHRHVHVSSSSVGPRTILNASARDEELFHRALLEARVGGGGGSATATTVASAATDTGPKATSKQKSGRGARKSNKKKGDDCTAYLGNLPYDATESQVRELFEDYGTVTRIYMPTDRNTGSFRGYAFVTLSSRDEMLKATSALDQSSFLGRIIYSNESVPKDQQKEILETKLYVGNISFYTTKDELYDFFSQYGTVRDVYIPLDKESGMPRGFAFIKMGKDYSDKVLDEANGEVLNGRTLSVSLSLPRGEKSKKPRRKKSVKLYVGNLSFSSDADSIRSLFEEYGEVLDCYMPLDRTTGGSRGFAFVSMEPDAAMRAADETDGYEWNGRVLRVNEAQPKSAGGGDSVSYGYDDGASDGDSWGDETGDESWGGESY